MKRQGLPLRKYLFYGLTIVLASVFIFLAIQGHRLEKERKQQGSEIIQQYTPTPIRVLAPSDLEILAAAMIREPGNDNTGQRGVVRHRIEIQNSGHVSYSEVLLELDYLSAGSRVLSISMQRTIKKRIPPGNTILSIDIPADKIPAEANDCRTKIIYADIEPGK